MNILFQTFIFDVDDFIYWKADSLFMKNHNKNWSLLDNQLIPKSDVIPNYKNPGRLSMEDIMKWNQFSEYQKNTQIVCIFFRL